LLIGYLVHYYIKVPLNLNNVNHHIVCQMFNLNKFSYYLSYMRRIVGKNKKTGKKILINIPSYDQTVINNQLVAQPAYDVSISSNSGSLG